MNRLIATGGFFLGAWAFIAAPAAAAGYLYAQRHPQALRVVSACEAPEVFAARFRP